MLKFIFIEASLPSRLSLVFAKSYFLFFLSILIPVTWLEISFATLGFRRLSLASSSSQSVTAEVLSLEDYESGRTLGVLLMRGRVE